MAAKSEEKVKKSASESLKESLDALKAFGRKAEPRIGFVYIILLLSAIGLSIFLVGQTLRDTSSGVAPQTTDDDFLIKFDDATIEKVRILNSTTNGSSNTAPELPDGRINPFAE